MTEAEVVYTLDLPWNKFDALTPAGRAFVEKVCNAVSSQHDKLAMAEWLESLSAVAPPVSHT